MTYWRASARKAASAMIAKIPLDLARHIARILKPSDCELLAGSSFRPGIFPPAPVLNPLQKEQMKFWHRITGRATPEGMVLLVLVVVIVWWTVAIWAHTPVAARVEFP